MERLPVLLEILTVLPEEVRKFTREYDVNGIPFLMSLHYFNLQFHSFHFVIIFKVMLQLEVSSLGTISLRYQKN